MTIVYYDQIGSSGASYSTPQEWLTGTLKNLVTADEIRIGVMYYTGQWSYPTDGLYINTLGAGTTDAYHYRQLMAASSSRFNHTGKYGAFIGGTTGGIEGGQDYFMLGPGIGVQVSGSVPWGISLSGKGILIDACTVYGVSGNGGIYLHDTSTTGAIINSLVYGTIGSGTGICTDNANVYILNNTVFSHSGGIGISGGTSINNISSIEDGTCFITPVSEGVIYDQYNASTDDTIVGVAGITGLEPLHQFWNTFTGTEDFRIKSKTYSDIYQVGLSMSEEIPNRSGEFWSAVRSALHVDLIGSSREYNAQKWDIGSTAFTGFATTTSSTFNSNKFKWYKSTYSGNTFTGMAGGPSTETVLYSGPFDLFPQIYSNSGFQFRKVFFHSDNPDTLLNTRVYLKDTEHIDQVSIAKEKTSGDYVSSATGYPSGYTSSDFISPYTYSTGLDFSGVVSGESIGIWVRLNVTGTQSDAYAGFNLIAEGE